jgi:23S rRNA pseudoU1915 N3-methylase RlmH
MDKFNKEQSNEYVNTISSALTILLFGITESIAEISKSAAKTMEKEDHEKLKEDIQSVVFLFADRLYHFL